jgi:hypothetical protein
MLKNTVLIAAFIPVLAGATLLAQDYSGETKDTSKIKENKAMPDYGKDLDTPKVSAIGADSTDGELVRKNKNGTFSAEPGQKDVTAIKRNLEMPDYGSDLDIPKPKVIDFDSNQMVSFKPYNPDQTLSTYKVHAKGFIINLPVNWVKKEGHRTSDLVVVSPLEDKDDNYNENLYVARMDLNPGETLDGFYGEFLKKANSGSFKKLEEKDIAIDGISGKMLVYSRIYKEQPRTCVAYILANQKHGYELVFMSSADKFSLYKALFVDKKNKRQIS